MAQPEAILITFAQFQVHNNQGHTIENLMAQYNVTREVLLAAMARENFYVLNGVRVHGPDLAPNLRIHLPPWQGIASRTFNYQHTFEHIMEHIAQLVGLPFGDWVASTQLHGQYILNNAIDWHTATTYFLEKQEGADFRRFSLTVHLVTPPGVGFGRGGGGGGGGGRG